MRAGAWREVNVKSTRTHLNVNVQARSNGTQLHARASANRQRRSFLTHLQTKMNAMMLKITT